MLHDVESVPGRTRSLSWTVASVRESAGYHAVAADSPEARQPARATVAGWRWCVSGCRGCVWLGPETAATPRPRTPSTATTTPRTENASAAAVSLGDQLELIQLEQLADISTRQQRDRTMGTPRWSEHANVFHGAAFGQPLMQGRRLSSEDYAHGMRLIFENQYGGEAPRLPFGCACLWCMACDLKIEYLTYGGPKPQLSRNQRRNMNRRARLAADEQRVRALARELSLSPGWHPPLVLPSEVAPEVARPSGAYEDL